MRRDRQIRHVHLKAGVPCVMHGPRWYTILNIALDYSVILGLCSAKG